MVPGIHARANSSGQCNTGPEYSHGTPACGKAWRERKERATREKHRALRQNDRSEQHHHTGAAESVNQSAIQRTDSSGNRDARDAKDLERQRDRAPRKHDHVVGARRNRTDDEIEARVCETSAERCADVRPRDT